MQIQDSKRNCYRQFLVEFIFIIDLIQAHYYTHGDVKSEVSKLLFDYNKMYEANTVLQKTIALLFVPNYE